MLRAVTVRNVTRSLVFQISTETEDARKSARISNAVAETYVLNQIEVKFEVTEQATTWLAARVEDLKISLETTEGQVKGFRAETDLINAEALQRREIQLKELRDRLEETQDILLAKQDKLAKMQAATGRIAQAEASGDSDLLDLLSRGNESSVAAEFDTRFAQLLVRQELDVIRTQDQLNSLKESRDKIEQDIDDQSSDLIKLEQLEREAEASRLLYEYFLSRLKETSAQEGIQQADSRVLSHAVVPLAPASPRKSLIFMASAVLGTLLGAVFVILRSMGKRTVRSAEELTELVGFEVSGQLPVIQRLRRKNVLMYLMDNPTSAASEAVRNLRTSILLRNIDDPYRTLMVTSSVPGEGKSTVSLALALNLSTLGKKVCYIEADMRREILDQYFPVQRSDGIVALMTGKATLDEVIIRDQPFGFDILPADRSKSNTADILSSPKFPEMLDALKKEYDHIILDTTPVLAVPDARILAPHCDNTVYVVRWDYTRKQQLLAGLQELQNISHTPISLVLNQIDYRKSRQYGYDGTYGAYGGGYYHK